MHKATDKASRKPGCRGLPPAVIVTGPTASGKSGLALALAKEFNGLVINADSMQVYRELAILTARPGLPALAAAPHRLYGVLSGQEACSAGRWRQLALAEIDAGHAAGRLPILVGGSGLYLRALEHGLTAIPGIPPAIRGAAAALHARLGGDAFHAALAARDPRMAERLPPGDTQRLIRAWEVLEATGRSLADWQDGGIATPRRYRFFRIALQPPRGELYAACDGRLLNMVRRGAVAEVRRLLALGLNPSLPVMKALGVRELSAHIRGTCDLAEAVARAQQRTRRYAKRQLTWLRTQGPREGPASTALNAQYSESLDQKTFTIIRQFLLTAAR